MAELLINVCLQQNPDKTCALSDYLMYQVVTEPELQTTLNSQFFNFLTDIFITFDAEVYAYIMGVMLIFLATGFGVGWIMHVVRMGR